MQIGIGLGRFSQEGYAALAVDLFSTGSRVACLVRIFHGMLLRPLTNGIVADLQAAMNFLKQRPEVDPQRIGVVGFCMDISSQFTRRNSC